MTDEAEVAAAAPEQSSAPETVTDEAVKSAEVKDAKAGQDDEGNKPEIADDKDAEPASAETEEDGDTDKPKKRTRTSQLRDKIREQAMEIEKLRRIEAERQSDQSMQPPKEADFNGDYEAYNRALIAHETAKLLKNDQSKATHRDIEERQAEIRRARLADHMERVAEYKKAVPDYDKVIEAGLNIQARPENLDLLMESDKSELIAYHLAEKPERAREFARMTPTEAAKHIGKLEVQLSRPKPKTTTEAPSPVPPLKGGAVPTPDPAKMDMAEYISWRKKQDKAS